MFLRKVQPCGRGSRQVYWELVESYRTARGSRQRTVAYLGKLARGELSGWQQLSRDLSGEAAPLPCLFEKEDDPAEPFIRRVDLKGVRLTRMRRFGDVYLAWVLWRMLGLDRLLESQMPAGQEHVAWPVVASILCLARFCRPSSELYIQDHFYPASALDDLLGVSCEGVNKDRLYGGLDRLLPCKQALEKHLRQRFGELFKVAYDILLYDLTSTYFEGQCAANPMARRGYSRDSRGDCPQVVIALIVTTDGYPLGYEVFDGNTADSTTVRAIVEKVEQQHGHADRIWVMDRGNVSQENLAFIRQRGGHYIVGVPKALLRHVQGHLTEGGWQQVRAGLEVKPVKLPGMDTSETLILCRSDDRVAKESAMLTRFADRMQEGLERLRKSAASGRLQDLQQASERLGRLKEKNWRAAACFQVSITPVEKATGCQKLTITWTRDTQAKNDLCGCYLLRTNLEAPDPVVLWKQYIQLVDAEWAFRISKDELEIRPVWHQHRDRVLAHILVCFIAYALWKTLAGWMQLAGLGEAPRSVLEELATIQSGDVVLPTRHPDGTPGETLTIRAVTRPDEHQAVLLARLGLKLPNHIKRFSQEDQALRA